MAFPKSTRTAWVVKSLAPANVGTQELKPYQFGMFNLSTWKSVQGATFTSVRDLIFAVGSPNTGQAIVNSRPKTFSNVGNVTESFKSEPIFGHNIDKVWVSEPATDPKPHIIYIGYDGVTVGKTFNLRSGLTYEIEVTVHGDAVRNVYGRDMREAFEITIPCANGDCCADTAHNVVPCSTWIDGVVEKINAGYLVSRFVKAEKVIDCCVGGSNPSKTNFDVYQMAVCDEGDSIALARVQGQYTDTVERVSRVGSTSTYQIVRLASAGAPAAFSTQGVVLVDCDTCPVGFTKVTNNFTYKLTKQDAGDAAALLTVATTYGIVNPESVVRLSYEFGSSTYLISSATSLSAANGANEVQTLTITGTPTGGTFTITFAGQTTAAIAYNASAATVKSALAALSNLDATDLTITGGALPGIALTITFGGIYANTNVPALTTTSSLTGGTSPTITIATSTAGSASDPLVFLGEGKSYCLQTTPTTSSWTDVGNRYKITRDLVTILTLDDCDNTGAADLAAIQAFYANSTDIVSGSISMVVTDNCKAKFTLSQYNNAPLEDGCDTIAVAKFDPVPSYNSHLWEVDLFEGWTVNGSGCPVPPAADDSDCMCGIKLTGTFVDRRTGGCAFDPHDKREYDAVRVEATIRRVSTDFCNTELLNDLVTVAQYPTFEQLSGQEVLRDVIKYRYYQRELYFSPSIANAAKWTRAEGLEYGVDVDKHYYALHLMHNVKKVTNNTASEPQHREEIVLYFEESDLPLLNSTLNLLNSYTTSVGIQLPVVV